MWAWTSGSFRGRIPAKCKRTPPHAFPSSEFPGQSVRPDARAVLRRGLGFSSSQRSFSMRLSRNWPDSGLSALIASLSTLPVRQRAAGRAASPLQAALPGAGGRLCRGRIPIRAVPILRGRIRIARPRNRSSRPRGSPPIRRPARNRGRKAGRRRLRRPSAPPRWSPPKPRSWRPDAATTARPCVARSRRVLGTIVFRPTFDSVGWTNRVDWRGARCFPRPR